MNSDINSAQWQKMQSIVSQHTTLIQSNSIPSYKKIIFKRIIFENIFVFLLQYTGLMISSINNTMPLELATGTACAVIFLRGYSILPGIFLGSICAFSTAHLPITYIIFHSTILTLQTTILFWLSCRFIIPTLLFYNKYHFIRFIVACFLLVSLSNYIANPSIWLNTSLADINGIFILGFMLIAWDAYFPQYDEFKKMRKYKLFLYLFFLLVSITGILMTANIKLESMWLLFNVLICILFSHQFKWIGAVSIQFINSMLICLLTPLINMSAEHFTILQIFILLNALICYSI